MDRSKALGNKCVSIVPALVLQALVDDYLFALNRVKRFCDAHAAALVFVYFPCYPQVYDPNTPMTIRDVLGRKCRELAIPFLDLTPAFRRMGRVKVLHLAPLDFHPNPDGNRLMAETIAEFLVGKGHLN